MRFARRFTGTRSNTVLAIITLKPGEKRDIALPIKQRQSVGWWTNLNWDQLNKCRNNCIKMRLKHFGTSVSSRHGGSLSAKPNKGQIEVVFENRETFAIPIQIYTQQVKLTKKKKQRRKKRRTKKKSLATSKN